MERENKREKTLESIAREKRLKATQKRPNSGNADNGLGDSIMNIMRDVETNFRSSFGQAA